METTVAAIQIVDYDSKWPEIFGVERLRLLRALNRSSVEVHHIGSAAVPGLAAKPIVDMLLTSRVRLSAEDVQGICELGYEYLGEHGIPDRQFFSKSGFHLHCFPSGHAEAKRHLAFRDFLRTHPETAMEYEALKRRLARQYRRDRAAYTDAKSDFIRRIDAVAAVSNDE